MGAMVGIRTDVRVEASVALESVLKMLDADQVPSEPR
jgi:hypothetical protein